MRYKESAKWAHRTLSLGQRREDALATVSALSNLTVVSMFTGDWESALDYNAQESALAEKIGAEQYLAWAYLQRAAIENCLGRLTAARSSMGHAFDTAGRAGDGRGTAHFNCDLVRFETDLGQDATARLCADQALAAASSLVDIGLNCLARWSAAYFHVQREEWSAAAIILDEAVTLLVGTDHRLGPLHFGPTHAEAYLGLGRVTEAAQMNDEHLALAREAGSRHFEALALRVQGQIRAAQGLHDEAEASFAAAIAILEPSGARLEWGRALYHRARLCHDLGQHDDARADATRARDLFAQCGAPRDLRRAETLLERLAAH